MKSKSIELEFRENAGYFVLYWNPDNVSRALVLSKNYYIEAFEKMKQEICPFSLMDESKWRLIEDLVLYDDNVKLLKRIDSYNEEKGYGYLEDSWEYLLYDAVKYNALHCIAVATAGRAGIRYMMNYKVHIPRDVYFIHEASVLTLTLITYYILSSGRYDLLDFRSWRKNPIEFDTPQSRDFLKIIYFELARIKIQNNYYEVNLYEALEYALLRI